MIDEVYSWLKETVEQMPYGTITLEIRKHNGDIVAVIQNTRVEKHFKNTKKNDKKTVH